MPLIKRTCFAVVSPAGLASNWLHWERLCSKGIGSKTYLLKEAVLRANGFDEMSLLRVIVLSHSLGSKDYMHSDTMYINDFA